MGDEIYLGDRARDRITRFEGFVTGVCTYLDGTSSLQIQAPALEAGKPIEPQWFGLNRVELVEKNPIGLVQSAVSSGPG